MHFSLSSFLCTASHRRGQACFSGQLLHADLAMRPCSRREPWPTTGREHDWHCRQSFCGSLVATESCKHLTSKKMLSSNVEKPALRPTDDKVSPYARMGGGAMAMA